MKKKFKASAQAYMYHLLMGIPLFTLSLIGLCLNITRLGLVLLFTAPLVASIALIAIAIYNVQFATLEDGVIRVYNIFGTINRIHVAHIKRAFYIEARVIDLPLIEKFALCIVLSESGSLRKREVRRACNRKEKCYVVLPYGNTNKRMIKKAYFEATGEELEITA